MPGRVAARCDLVLRGRPRPLGAGTTLHPIALPITLPIALNDPSDAPAPARRAGSVVSVEALSPGVLQVVVALTRRLDYRPGQHVRVALGGLSPRDYVPTLRVDGTADLNELVLHVRRGEGRVARALSTGALRPGTLARVQGPFGTAHHRPGQGRLVLVASGAGFGAIWAIARAARYREPERPMALVAGARDGADLYMRPALAWLAATGVPDLVLCASGGRDGGDVRAGRVTAHLPTLRAGDVVHAAGPPAMVAAVTMRARAAGARCHPLPFLPWEAAATRRTGLAGP